MSFLKYVEDESLTKGNGRGPVSFNRAHVDGMPYRGKTALLREEEYEELTEIVRDGGIDIFDMTDPEQKAKIQKIVDAAANGWFQIYEIKPYPVNQPDGSFKLFVYCVWSAPHRELAKHRVPQGLLQQPNVRSQA